MYGRTVLFAGINCSLLSECAMQTVDVCQRRLQRSEQDLM